jgi:hypothetical protein
MHSPGSPQEEASSDVQVLRQVLESLPLEDQRMLQFCATYTGDNWEAVYAGLMGINSKTVRSRYSRVRKKIKEEMTHQARPLEDLDPAGRRVRVWFEGVVDGFWVHKTYRLGVDIVGPAGAPAEGQSPSPGWGGVEQVDIQITVSGNDVTATPHTRPAMLPAVGNMGPVYFDVQLERGGRVPFFITLWTAGTLQLLQKLRVVVPGVKSIPG